MPHLELVGQTGESWKPLQDQRLCQKLQADRWTFLTGRYWRFSPNSLPNSLPDRYRAT